VDIATIKSLIEIYTNLTQHNLGELNAGIDLQTSMSLEVSEINLSGTEKRRFLEFMRKMLRWDPEQRSSAGELYQDHWLQEQHM
jgi:hypothetical protein